MLMRQKTPTTPSVSSKDPSENGRRGLWRLGTVPPANRPKGSWKNCHGIKSRHLISKATSPWHLQNTGPHVTRGCGGRGGWHFLQGLERGTRVALLGQHSLLIPRLRAKVWLRLSETFGAIYLILFEKSLFQVVTGMTAQNKTNLRLALLLASRRSSRERRHRRTTVDLDWDSGLEWS